MLDKMKDMYALQKQAKDIKKQLENIHIEAEYEGVTVVMNGNMKVISMNISDSAYEKGADKLGKICEKAFTKAMDKSQKIAAENMKGMMGGMMG
jgi:DNA-binding protein YbaB